MRILSYVAAAALLAIGALSFVVGVINATSHGGSKDFQWSIARYLLSQENPYRLYLDYKAGRLVSSPFVASELPVYPASSEIFLWPLAAIDYGTATWIWAGLNGLFAVGCVLLTARIANLRGPIVLCLVGLFLASTPVRNTIGNGQQGLWSLFFLLSAVHCQQQKRWVLAGLFLAASWLKYTITAPLSIIFIRRGSRAPIGVAIGTHIALTLFLGIWMQDNPFRLLVSPFILSDTAQSASMFDVMAVATYIGLPSIAWSAPIGIALFCAGAIYVARSEDEDITALSLLAMVALLWTYHWQYDYFVLVIPLVHALKRWTDGAVQFSDLGIGTAVILIWFVQRVLDSAVLRFPAGNMIVTLDRGVFWFTCFVLYAILFHYMFAAKTKTP
jgi:hypothetical protein